MTPAQRKYDQDFVASLRNVSRNMEPRSRKLADMLKIAAERIDALSASAPVDPVPVTDASGQAVQQPASTPDGANAQTR
jgi:hypothetical protein